jgi:hypothetical protein
MTAYQISLIKRHRSTKVEIGQRRQHLYDIVSAGQPMTVRQVFYQATVRGIVEKAESGYAKVQTDLTLMRRAARAKNFGSISVELDAIEPNTLRDIVSNAIEKHLPEHQYEVLKAAEESERKLIARLVAKVRP